MRRHVKEIIVLSLFLIASFAVGIVSFLSSNPQTRTTTNTYAAELADVSLEPYCKDGYYSIPGEPEKCSRAPGCGGYDYDELNVKDKMPNPQKCTSDPKACGGKPPLCCYEMARTGDFTKCIGYWERLWCPKQLCDAARSKGASDSQCGGSCQCSHAFDSYCGTNVQIVPLSQRLGQAPQPTDTPKPTNTPTTPPQQATPTTRPADTATPVPPENNNPENNNPASTNTPIPTATRVPTPTIQPQTGSGGGASMNSNNNNSDFPTSIPTPTTGTSTTTDNKNGGALEFAIPHIALKSPGEMVKETVTEEKIVKLNEVTDPPLKVAKTTFVSVKSYDQQLENTFRNWIESVRVQVLKLIQ